jgi:pyruvate dehydrogenase E2 component (dihydrolipoamide acetyltransferase)
VLAITEIKVPDIGDFKNVPVIEMHVQPGVRVNVDDPLVTLESDKATMDVPATQAGTVEAVLVKIGDRVSEGTPILRLRAEEAAADSPVTPPPSVIALQEPAPQTGRAVAPAAAPAGGMGIPEIPALDFSKFGPVETKPLVRIKRLSGPHLHRSWLNIPHVTHGDEADITEIEAYRKELDAAGKEKGYRVTLLAFLLKASVSCLKAFPEFNSSLSPDKDSLILKKYYNIGVAVDTPEGLVVPVIKDADRKGIVELSQELGTVSKKARDGKLAPGDMQGGCFTISSLGGIGGTDFTPIVNAPEVAILGVVRSKMAPVWDGEAFVPRLMLPLYLSYDHRVIDGALAARFTRQLCTLLEDVRRLVL